MKYMFLVYSPESAWTDAEWLTCVKESWGLCKELADQGKFLAASPLHSVARAKTVRVRQGELHVTAGPFAETVEQLGGFYLLELENLDEAISIASRLPPTRKGTVEIRPLSHDEELPQGDPLRKVPEGMSRFMLICYEDESYWQSVGAQLHQQAIDAAMELANSLDRNGRLLSASPLCPTSTATSVRVRQDKRMITDGPFAETREVPGGYYLLVAENVDEAVAIATRHPGAQVGAVEVREVHDASQ